MRIKYEEKISFFIMWLLYVQLIRGKKRYGLVWAIMTSTPELPTDNEARKQAQVCDCISTKNETGN